MLKTARNAALFVFRAVLSIQGKRSLSKDIFVPWPPPHQRCRRDHFGTLCRGTARLLTRGAGGTTTGFLTFDNKTAIGSFQYVASKSPRTLKQNSQAKLPPETREPPKSVKAFGLRPLNTYSTYSTGYYRLHYGTLWRSTARLLARGAGGTTTGF